MKKISLILTSIVLAVSVLLNVTGCMTVSATNLMTDVVPNKVTPKSDMKAGNVAVTDFVVRLLGATLNGENTLISPLSVVSALAMTLNGAEGDTLAEMESVLGMSRDEVNLYLYTYVNSLPKGEKYKLNIANSIWFTDDSRFSVNRDFLQTNADFYGADIYKAPFDNTTLKDINNWVKDKTDRMIPKVLDELSADAVMYLVNALAFEAEWSKIYEDHQVRDGKFTKEDGTEQNVEFMYSSDGKYIEDESATGFIKYYKDHKYAFAALLPNEGVSVSEYVASLDGEKLNTILSGAESVALNTSIPKFKTEYSKEMSEILCEMGMPTAFDSENADFKGLGESVGRNIFINNVIHKTFIEVGEKGTRAGAVTVIEMNDMSACPPDEIKEIYLDRPFVYMLIDCENNVPFFIGTLMDAGK